MTGSYSVVGRRRSRPVAFRHVASGDVGFEHAGDPEHDTLPQRRCEHLHADRQPASPVPYGTLIAAWPARLVGIVQMSDRYIASGSAVLAPSANATVGDVGDSSASYCS
jgi:hypothetical protein